MLLFTAVFMSLVVSSVTLCNNIAKPVKLTGKYNNNRHEAMAKQYLFFVTLPYSYSILRPLQQEIWRRGDKVAWYIVPDCADMLLPGEERLDTIQAVKRANPIAVFAPGNMIYDFFPGVKVAVFHGYPIRKRGEQNDQEDDHFSIRGWFDIICTQGESSTQGFLAKQKQHGFFKVYQTGWCKTDGLVTTAAPSNKQRKTVLYSTTFTRGISAAPVLYDTIARLVQEQNWDWILTFHPKFNDQSVLAKYLALAEKCENVRFEKQISNESMQEADVMLCDSSSIILEFMLLDKPVVTYRNTSPGEHLLNVTQIEDVEPALVKAMTRPTELMQKITEFTEWHEAHKDGKNAARVLDAVDDFIAHHQGRLLSKPVNVIRKLKLRMQSGYYCWR